MYRSWFSKQIRLLEMDMWLALILWWLKNCVLPLPRQGLLEKGFIKRYFRFFFSGAVNFFLPIIVESTICAPLLIIFDCEMWITVAGSGEIAFIMVHSSKRPFRPGRTAFSFFFYFEKLFCMRRSSFFRARGYRVLASFGVFCLLRASFVVSNLLSLELVCRGIFALICHCWLGRRHVGSFLC